MLQLKDGTITQDPRLDRLVQFDEESREYPIRSLVSDTKPLRSYTWSLAARLDQGTEGACVGFSLEHELNARPGVITPVSVEHARHIYHQAQRTDEWAGGSYDGATPFYEGTSVLAGVKFLHEQGFFKEYRWAFSLEDALLALGYKGPGVLGTNWYTGMFNTDENGFIHPTGTVAGGHAILVRGVNVKGKYVLLTNSWGTNWGVNGDCKLSFEDFGRLLSESGEFCIPIARTRS